MLVGGLVDRVGDGLVGDGDVKYGGIYDYLWLGLVGIQSVVWFVGKC